MTLQQLDPIYADFPVPEEALNALATGQAVRMTVDAIPGRSFEGKVEAIDARVSADLRNVTARAVFANPDRKLLPGMFANIQVTTGDPVDVLTLPRTAIIFSLYGDNIFVVSRRRPGGGRGADRDKGCQTRSDRGAAPALRVGEVRGERVAIVEGVSAGERVVTAGQIKLQANAPVVLDVRRRLPPRPKRPVHDERP